MNEEEIKEMLIALKNNWTIDFAKMEELCDCCLTTINQLQSYKDKEEKLREYLTNTEFEERTAYDTSFCEGVYNTKEKALQILNEGDK